MHLPGYRLILGSASPRRKELLAGLDLDFTVDTATDCDESYDPAIPREEIPLRIAEAKSAGFHRPLADDEVLITADTMVFCDEAIMGKPKNREEAVRMLRTLSGRTHTVTTGVYVRSNRACEGFTCTSEVVFSRLEDSEIEYYVDKYSPLDKAGAYGIQEWIGYIGITSIKGSYYNIMGLPVQRLYSVLKRLFG